MTSATGLLLRLDRMNFECAGWLAAHRQVFLTPCILDALCTYVAARNSPILTQGNPCFKGNHKCRLLKS